MPRFAALVLLGTLLCARLCARAQAQQPLGPYFEADALPVPGYELRSSLGFYFAEREDFRELVFLVPQPVARITAHELRGELDLRVSITRSLALQAVVPITVRSADVELQDLVVSLDQVLAGRTLELRGAGVADPTLALAYRLLRTDHWDLHAELGTRVPIEDNPGSPVLPEELPLGTGQNQVFVGLGGSVRSGGFDASLGYRFEYQPGSSATYLVREVDPQGYTSGALDSWNAHRVSGSAGYAFDDCWSLRLQPDFRADEQPVLVERAGTTPFLADRFRYELVLTGSVQLRLGEGHALRLSYSQPLLRAWEHDPFFPISIPDQGVGLTWRVTAR